MPKKFTGNQKWFSMRCVPAGLLQFSTGQPPRPEDARSLPATSVPHVTVQEEDGQVRLLVVRAQGLLGTVSVEFRTVSETASSPGDYQVSLPNPLPPFESVPALVEQAQSFWRMERQVALLTFWPFKSLLTKVPWLFEY